VPRPTRTRWLRASILLFLLTPAVALGSTGADAFASALLALAVILGGAKLGGDLASRLGQPSVLGELVVGVILGNLDLAGISFGEAILADPFVHALAELGVVLLLFEVGLESTVSQMLRVGGSALAVAVLGVIAPMILGFGVGLWLLPEASTYVHLFLGATLSATSVGITARVLKDLGQVHTPEARIILGAAVIDDVLGLVVLAAVTALIQAADAGAAISAGPVLLLALEAIGFLGVAIGLGVLLTPALYRAAAHLRGGGVLLGTSLAFCFGLSWLASAVNLAPIVGAFAAGLILESAHYRPFVERGDHQLEELIHPVVAFLGPIFFVFMGMRVDLATFADTSVLGLATALTVVAILGKQVSSLGILQKDVRRLPVGVGMIPRGEVGLIFANIGMGLHIGGVPIVSAAVYSAVVVMVIATTLVTPPLLAWAFGSPGERKA
jgi:Kef-type K+ transport system membrane component KefB